MTTTDWRLANLFRDVGAPGFLGRICIFCSVVNLYLVITWPLGFDLVGQVECYVIINPNEDLLSHNFSYAKIGDWFFFNPIHRDFIVINFESLR